jgi:hypothetical protein
MAEYSPFATPNSAQIVDKTTGRGREDWLQWFDNLKKRVNAIVGVLGFGSVATDATSGFLYVPTCAGPPSGAPAAITGMSPIVIDSTNNKLYFYSSGSWRDAGP